MLRIPKNTRGDADTVLGWVCQQGSLSRTDPSPALSPPPAPPHFWVMPINHEDELYINVTTKLKLRAAPTLNQNQQSCESCLLKIGSD